MNKLDYFKLAVSHRCYSRMEWLIGIFAKMVDDPEAGLNNIYPYKLVPSPTVMKYYDPDKKDFLIIDDYIYGEALFKPTDLIRIDKTICSNITEDGEILTTIGNVIANFILLIEPFKNKIPYINDRFDLSNIENNYIGPNLTSEPEDGTYDPSKFYVSQNNHFGNNAGFIEELNMLVTVVATEKTLTPAPGINEFKEKLIKEYGDTLSDPIKLNEMEGRLEAYDEDYIKDDPTFNKYLAGKTRGIARKRLYIDVGYEQGFKDTTSITPILNSYSEGLPKDAKLLATLFNTSRAGSFFRGAETQNGGMQFKSIVRSFSSVSVADEDCGTTLYKTTIFTKQNYKNLIDLYIVEEGKLKLIEDESMAKQYIDKPVNYRSTIYCKHDNGFRFCKICIGRAYASRPEAIVMNMNVMSRNIITISLKAMHGKALKTTKLNIRKQLS